MPKHFEVDPQNASSASQFATIRGTARRLGTGDRPLREARKRGELNLYEFGTSRGLLYWPEVLAWALSTKRAVPEPSLEPKDQAGEWAASKLLLERELDAA